MLELLGPSLLCPNTYSWLSFKADSKPDSAVAEENMFTKVLIILKEKKNLLTQMGKEQLFFFQSWVSASVWWKALLVQS